MVRTFADSSRSLPRAAQRLPTRPEGWPSVRLPAAARSGLYSERGGDRTAKTSLQRLKNISFFAEVPQSELRQVAEIVALRSYRSGDVIIEELAEADRFFIIDEGKIEITKRLEHGDDLVLAVRGDGDFFGEMALLDSRPRSASARAVAPTTVLEISLADFEEFLYKAPRLAFRIMRELSGRLRETDALLISHLQQSNRLLFRSNLDTIAMVVEAIERRDPRTRSHTGRITEIARTIGKEMRVADEELLILELSTLLRDMGMLAVPEGIREKPGPLTASEYAVVQGHTMAGRRMLEGIPFLERAIPHVVHHHERFDGTGYPDGLSGEEIPMASRIVAVVDAFGAMTSERPYRKRLRGAEAIAEITERSATQFDPAVVRVLVRLWESGTLQDFA